MYFFLYMSFRYRQIFGIFYIKLFQVTILKTNVSKEFEQCKNIRRRYKNYTKITLENVIRILCGTQLKQKKLYARSKKKLIDSYFHLSPLYYINKNEIT